MSEKICKLNEFRKLVTDDLKDTISKLILGKMEGIDDVEYSNSIISIKSKIWKSTREFRNRRTQEKFEK